MRQSLMETFDDIYILDLHGNTKKKERAPDGGNDENIFDIQQGVAVGIFVKKKNGGEKKKLAKVRHADLWGTRETWSGSGVNRNLIGGKYWWLWNNDAASTPWANVKPNSPFYLFRSQDASIDLEYRAYWSLPNIMPINVLGFQTHRDKFSIAFDETELRTRLDEMRDVLVSDTDFAARYALKDSQGWKLAEARKAICEDPDWENKITACLYRPFDWRHCYFSKKIMDRPRRELLDHVFSKENCCILVPRQIGTSDWKHASISKHVAESCLVSTKTREQNYNFPIYLYPDSDRQDLFENEALKDTPDGRQPNLDIKFIGEFSGKLGLVFVNAARKGDLKKTFGPEDVVAYIYAILHSTTYRERYGEFLRIDFPRIPLTSSISLFRAVCALGAELIDLHLMDIFGPAMTSYPVEGSNTVKKLMYTEPMKGSQGRIWINEAQYFEGVSEDVWNFHVGAHQVCQKWLNDRKGRTLDFQDIQHYQHIVSALSETIRCMTEIDAAIDNNGGWPIS